MAYFLGFFYGEKDEISIEITLTYLLHFFRVRNFRATLLYLSSLHMTSPPPDRAAQVQCTIDARQRALAPRMRTADDARALEEMWRRYYAANTEAVPTPVREPTPVGPTKRAPSRM